MKKYLLSFCITFLAFISAFSQSKTPQEQANEQAKMLSKELGLEGKQAQQLSKILVSSYISADKVRHDTRISKETKKQQLTEIYALRKSAMMSILTDAQKLKYNEFISKRNTK